MSVAVKVNYKVQRMRKGVPFTIDKFYDLGSSQAVQKALSRLNKEGVVERVSKGIYVRPKPLVSIPSIKVTASAEQVARVWAQKNKYALVDQGLESAYRLGLQTQAPVRTIFWSNGPSRTFSVGKEVVEVRHASEQKLKWRAKPEGVLLRGLIVTPPSAVGENSLKKAFKRLGLTNDQVKATVRKLQTIPLSKGWRQKLKEFSEGSP